MLALSVYPLVERFIVSIKNLHTTSSSLDATNRKSKYNIFPSDNLRLGFVVHRNSKKQMNWEEVL